jgi:hypothetical protein
LRKDRQFAQQVCARARHCLCETRNHIVIKALLAN